MIIMLKLLRSYQEIAITYQTFFQRPEVQLTATWLVHTPLKTPYKNDVGCTLKLLKNKFGEILRLLDSI